MILRSLPFARLLVLAPLALAACNQSTPRTAEPAAGAPVAAAPALPGGAGCSTSVTTFRRLIDSDLQVGHTTKSVHAQVTQEINAAAQICAAGNDAGARSAITASRSRHGYPAG